MPDLLDVLRRWPERVPDIPPWIWEAHYDVARHPQAVDLLAEPVGNPELGANCQLYAYAVLQLSGREVPPHRSSELWEDTSLAHPRLGDLEPWDLVLFARGRDRGPGAGLGGPDAYGAHVAVYLGGDRLLHLCTELGRPAVWTWADFAARQRYATVVGAVRVPAEEPLAGGNMTAVVRVGDTVRRTVGPWTSTIHAYLRHVRARGVTEVPEPFGRDDQGREIVSFLPGDVPGWPAPEWLWSEQVLLDAGRLLRRLHDASVDLDLPDAVWQLPAHEPAEVICHNDAAPYNMVFREGRLVGLIDMDTASPGPRLWDLAYTAYRLAPFAADASEDDASKDDASEDGPSAGDPSAGASHAVGHLDPMTRLDTLVAAYGATYSRAEVLAAMVERLTELAAFSEARADGGGPAELREHAVMYRADAARIEGLAAPTE